MNRLGNETSPYLLQHKDNPVDWQPWDAQALAAARAEDKPIFLSIGYSACHWCHVMEHESFENEQIAALLNRHFVCIKVDREERPDLDHIYMQAVQLMTGRGGWPMSVFLTPDLQPFFGGTYWPPTSRMGMPGFDQVLTAVADAWMTRRGVAVQQAAQLTSHLQSSMPMGDGGGDLTVELITDAARRLSASSDRVHGGFGAAPKFPHAVDLQVLLRAWARNGDADALDVVCLTLDKMASGGLYDQLGGGFARYSVDDRWLVPHFEKMLYDNALLVEAYLDGWLVTGHRRYADVARATCDYVLRDLSDAEGGFHSSEDADSEGEEGAFYVWTPAEVKSVLGQEAGERFCQVYDVTDEGNFEGRNILHLRQPVPQLAAERGWELTSVTAELQESRARLFEARRQRVRPGKDDKVITAWNAMMIHALARAAGILDRADYLEAARRAADFLLARLRRPDGRLLHCWRQHQAKLDAYLDDYAYLIHALVTLYETDWDERWLEESLRLTEDVVQHFQDSHRGGFYFTADDHESLITRTKELFDASVPSSNAVLATALVRLAKLTGQTGLLDLARHTVQLMVPVMQSTPEAVGQMVLAADLLIGPTWEIVLVGDPTGEDLRAVHQQLLQQFIPRRVVAGRGVEPGSGPCQALDALFAGKAPADNGPRAYVCRDFTCRAPVEGRAAIISTWEKLRGNGDTTAR